MSLLQLIDVTKRFDAVVALNGVSLNVQAGEVRGIVGENGAGKSTLMKIISGSHIPTEGEVQWNGATVRFRSPRDALDAGVSIIHQELSLLPNLTVAENIYLGREPLKRGTLVDNATMESNAAALLERLELPVSPSELTSNLSIGLKQMVELAKALSFESQLVIMDEPTSSLTNAERDRLLAVVAQLRDSGVSVLYISHRLDEILDATDMVTVLRDGEHIDTRPTSELTANDIVALMVGRELEAAEPRSITTNRPIALQVEGLRDDRNELDSVDLEVREGEIVGLAGLIGAGRTAVAETIFGIRRATSGTIHVHGKPYIPSTPASARSTGIALVPEERRDQGLFLDMSIHDNGIMSALGTHLARMGIVRRKAATDAMSEVTERLQIKLGKPSDTAATLSGGNQQKLLVGRWLAIDPSIILLDEPTRGVDVGAKSEIRNVMRTLADDGKAILTISSDLPELLSVCDRILVMYAGRVVDEVSIEHATEERIVGAASGPKAATA